MNQEETDEILTQMVNDMSPEARSILENHLRTDDPENYEYYIENINPSADAMNISVEIDLYAADAMATLGKELVALGLTSQIVIALKGAAAEMLALSSLTPVGIVAILTAAAISAIIVSNWSTIGPKWNQIVTAFQKAIGKSISAVGQGFSQANTQYNQRVNDMNKAKGRARVCPQARSIAKHIDSAFVKTFLRNSNNEEQKIFYSTKNRVAMIMFKIGKGNTASINETFTSDSSGTKKYSNTDTNLGGFTMYILYDCVNDEIFHCHVRYRTDDTNEMRRANGLDWMIYPEMKRDTKYDLFSSSLRLNGTQLK